MLKVGGEVDSLCTKCSMMLAHTIIAMVEGRPVKVECNTCHSVHRFRGDLPSSPSQRRSASAARPRPVHERPANISFDEALRSKNMAMAQRYSPRTTYQLDQLIEHPTFGLGWVSEVRDSTKIEVTFRNDVKVLVHGRA